MDMGGGLLQGIRHAEPLALADDARFNAQFRFGGEVAGYFRIGLADHEDEFLNSIAIEHFHDALDDGPAQNRQHGFGARGCDRM